MNSRVKKMLIGAIAEIGTNLVRISKAIGASTFSGEYKESSVERILVISLHFIGDVVFSTPILRALREKFPHAHIVIWVKSRAYEAVISNRDVDEILVFDDISSAKGSERINKFNYVEKLRFILGLRQRDFDLSVDLTGLWSTALIAFLAGIEYRIGFNQHGFGFFLNGEVEYRLDCHVRGRQIEVLKAIGLTNVDRKLRFYVNHSDRSFAEDLLSRRGIKKDRLVFGIHPSAGWESKCWGRKKFAGLCEKLIDLYKAQVVLLGSMDDLPIVEEIKSYLTKPVFIAAGKSTLPQSAAIISMCDMFIGHDTGLTHIAEALSIPTVTIFGPTNPHYFAPQDNNHLGVLKQLQCSPRGYMTHCQNKPGYICKEHKCMAEISIHDVTQEIGKLLLLTSKRKEQ